MKFGMLFGLVGLLMTASSVESEELFSGMQKYKLSRVSEFVVRMENSAAKVMMENDLAVGVSFGNYHLSLVDDHLSQLISNHPRELPFTSVTYYMDDTSQVNDLRSANLLSAMGVNVHSESSSYHCMENDVPDCRIYLIQFFTTEKGI